MDSKKDTNISLNTPDSKNTIILRLFEKDSPLLFAYKKLERIVSALYLVTNFLSDLEPIKWQFRSVGNSILSQTLSLSFDPLSKSELANQMTNDLVKLLSLLDISYVAGLISEMNFNILKKELANLLEILNEKLLPAVAQPIGKVVFDKEFFSVPADQLGSGGASGGGQNVSRVSFPGNEKSRVESIQGGLSDSVRSYGSLPKGQYKGHQTIKDRSSATARSGEVSSESHAVALSRRTAIIDLLKTKSDLTIQDFISIIKGCSSKTVQRELLKLVKDGVLKKEGERRWSRYSLATR